MKIRYISLGGGVQSSVLTLMADRGEFGEVPDAAIWADTGWDPPSTRATVEWLGETVGFPVHIVSDGNLADDTIAGRNSTGQPFLAVPSHGRGADGRTNMAVRQCTTQYKVVPIHRRAREIAGLLPRQHAEAHGVSLEQWLGISFDEVHRMRPAKQRWVTNRWPLVERKMTRKDCERWWQDNAPAEAPPLGRSSCVGCPFHSAATWVDMADRWPAEMKYAAEVDRRMREHDPGRFLHRRCLPLPEAIEIDRQSLIDGGDQLDLFDDGSCDGGVCFV